MSSDDRAVVVDTVGSLLADVANLIQDALRILMFADKRAWESPEFEQLRLLEETLDEAKRDFQELPVFVNGRFYYESDQQADSLEELRELCSRFRQLSANLKYWVRAGGPVETEWAAETRWLRRELHRAQCRAVRRIHDDLEGSLSRSRCLGALIVWRSQQRQQSHRPQPQPQSQSQPRSPPSQQRQPHRTGVGGLTTNAASTTQTTRSNSIPTGEIAACNSTGTFQRLGPGNQDIAFVCDFCDGFLVWEDLRSMPSTRRHVSVEAATAATATTAATAATAATASTASLLENWAATGFTHPRPRSGPSKHPPVSGEDAGVELQDRSENAKAGETITTTQRELDTETEAELRGEEKTIVFPPVAIAHHLPPEPGEWQAPLLCPLCEEYYYEEQGDDDMDRVRYTQDERGFESVALLQEHLEWTHASLLPSLANVAPRSSSCTIM
ncbi:hypothetical protein F5Y14DRAFT_376790 [Nemania sp. NC0429]|nr:hypothetical protein F5Y14DRAFT_376790 [Nemania sp. NC0429]